MRFAWRDLETVAGTIFARLGAPPDEAALVARLLVRADLQGHPSHGVMRIPEYVEACRRGLARPGASVAVEARGPAAVVVDGGFGFGQVVASRAMAAALERARVQGSCTATVRRCNHVGRLADAAEQAAAEGMIGLLFANDSGALQRVAPHGAVEGRLSTNPLAVGIPRRKPPHLVVDLSTSAVASGKLRAAIAAGQRVPEGWVQDAEGRPSTDPAIPYAPAPGTILPAGGHKGFALGLVVEVLAGVLSGSGFSRPAPAAPLQGLCLAAIDVGRFLPLDDFVSGVETLLAHVRSARPAPGKGGLEIPGERGWRMAERLRAEGVPIAPPTWEAVAHAARELSVALPAPLAG